MKKKKSNPTFLSGYTGWTSRAGPVGQIIWSGTVTIPPPRYHGQIYWLTDEEESIDDFKKWAMKIRAENDMIEGINGS